MLAVTPAWGNEEPAEGGTHPLRFEEVLVSDIAEPKPPGVFWVGLKPRLRPSPEELTLDIPLHLETGLVTDLGVEVILPGRVYTPRDEETAAGLGDLSTLIKYDFMGAAFPDYALSAGVEATFPTGKAEEGVSDLAYEVGPVLLFSVRRGSLETHIDFEVGLPVATTSAPDVEAETHATMGASLATHYRLGDGLGLIGELVSQVDLADGGDTVSLVAGLWIEPIESIEIGLGTEIPLDPRPGEYPGVVAAIWRLF